MKSLHIPHTDETPDIVLDGERGIFEIVGRSLPEDCVEFYRPVFEWLEQYLKKPNTSTQFVFKLEYMNTASSKLIQDLITQLEKITGSRVVWFSREDDEDMAEVGRELSEIIRVPFEFKSF